MFTDFTAHASRIFGISFPQRALQHFRDENLPPHFYCIVEGSDERTYRFCLMDSRIILDDMIPLCFGLLEETEQISNKPVKILWQCENDSEFWYIQRDSKNGLILGTSEYVNAQKRAISDHPNSL